MSPGAIDTEDVVAAARAFAARSVLPLLERQGPDGALERMVDVGRDALAAGLIAAPSDPDSSALALWGRDLGALASCRALEEIGRACAGSGMALHVDALAARLRIDVGLKPAAATAVACPIAPRCPPLAVLEDPRAEDGAWVPQSMEQGALRAGFETVWAFATDPAPFEVLAFLRGRDGWELVHMESPGPLLSRNDAPRLGLRACPLMLIAAGPAKAVVVASGADARRLLHAHLTRLWSGMAALGAGIAGAAVRAASAYATERFQGGRAIANHAAVQELLGEATARAASAAQSLSDDLSLVGAACRKLTCIADAASAVTSSLQVMGGNGYMEDFRMEKRLRDVEVLRTSHGTPIDLRRILAGSWIREVSS